MNYETLREEFEGNFLPYTFDAYQGMNIEQLEKISEWWLSKIASIEKETEARTLNNMYNYADQVPMYDRIPSAVVNMYAASRGIELK